mmetsp:Transcript_28425/g.65992  ORF Transcript_28425/g.65992 Transcript_28425/m.65992 type:complete len:87 (-) Transcript_28425:752-1012(-)
MIVEFVKSNKLSFQCIRKKGDEQLVSFMRWHSTRKSQEMKIKMAKGSDVALNCIVALVSTIVKDYVVVDMAEEVGESVVESLFLGG